MDIGSLAHELGNTLTQAELTKPGGLDGTLPSEMNVGNHENLDGGLPKEKIDGINESLQGDMRNGELPQENVSNRELAPNLEANFNPEVEQINTINSKLEGTTHPVTEVAYNRKEIALPDGRDISGVFPEFNSTFDVQMPEEMYLKTDREQFDYCTEQLKCEVNNNPDLESTFSEEQLDQIRNGDTPDGFIWHHNEEPGKMQLADEFDHGKSGHTGGRSLWGGGSEMRGAYIGSEPV